MPRLECAVRSIRSFLPQVLLASLVLALAISGGTPTEAALTTCGAGTSRQYTALGDSIVTGAAGWPPFDWNGGPSYASYLRDFLSASGGTTTFVNFAKNGDTSGDLLGKLMSSAGLRAAVQQACVITVCIGGNDLLGCGSWPFASVNTGCLDAGAARFEANWPKILAQIRALNSKASLYAMTVYNPVPRRDTWLWPSNNDKANHDRLEVRLQRINGKIRDAGLQATYNYEVAEVHDDWLGRFANGKWKVESYTNFPWLRDPHPTDTGDRRARDLHWVQVCD
jgi:lysophospholipase L1-like esterase